jgi:hypothetical protein
MAHYAFINPNTNKVVEVITGRDETDTENLPEGFSSWEDYYETKRDGLICKRTSYNTFANEHVNEGTAFRGNYATIGGIYDSDNDVFYRSQPFGSWTLDTSTWQWVSPVPYPTDGNIYIWSEITYESDNTTGWLQV